MIILYLLRGLGFGFIYFNMIRISKHKDKEREADKG